MSSNFTKQIIPIFLFQSPVHIPNWLLRVPEEKLSYSAKILYGYMAQMSDCVGVFTILKSHFWDDLGMSRDTYISALTELHDSKLINCRSEDEYEFYDHKWMEGKYDE